MAPQNLRAVGDRIEQLLDELHEVADPRALAIAEELLRSLTDLYGGGLERVMALASDDAPAFAQRLVDDELVGSLLVAHGLHPDDVETRVERALESVRPFLAEHDAAIELLDIDLHAAAVHLRLSGAGDGCGSAGVTLQLTVETAVIESAPEIVTIDVDRPAPKPPSVPVTLGRKVANA
jgi:Fe-S cluster biogenesis protein NfuA